MYSKTVRPSTVRLPFKTGSSFVKHSPVIESVAKDNLHSLDPVNLLLRKERLIILDQALSQISRNDLEILKLYFGFVDEPKSVADIVKEKNTTIRSVNLVLERCFKRLRIHLEFRDAVSLSKLAGVSTYTAEEIFKKHEQKRRFRDNKSALDLINQSKPQDYGRVALLLNDPYYYDHIRVKAKDKFDKLMNNLILYAFETSNSKVLFEIAGNASVPSSYRLKAGEVILNLFFSGSYTHSFKTRLWQIIRSKVEDETKACAVERVVQECLKSGNTLAASSLATDTRMPYSLQVFVDALLIAKPGK